MDFFLTQTLITFSRINEKRGVRREEYTEVKFFPKKLAERFYRFKKERERVVKLSLAIATVFLLSGILCGLLLVQVAPNYQPFNPMYKAESSYWNSTSIENQGEIQLPYDSSDSNQAEPDVETDTNSSNGNTITTVGVSAYWDLNLTDSVNDIDWGDLVTGTNKSYVIYIFNEGNTAVTLSMSTLNWNPPIASNYLNLTWSYSGHLISAGTTVPVTFTLAVSSNITGVEYFNFDIKIEGKG